MNWYLRQQQEEQTYPGFDRAIAISKVDRLTALILYGASELEWKRCVEWLNTDQDE